MMEYTVGTSVSVTAGVVSLVFINPAAAPANNIEILRAWAGQAVNATSAQQRIQHETQVTAFPTVTGATPAKLKRAGPISTIVSGTAGAAGTCGTNASAEGAGTKTAIFDDAFNVLNGYLWVPTPRETIVMPASSTSGYGLYMPVTPTPAGIWNFGVNFGEV